MKSDGDMDLDSGNWYCHDCWGIRDSDEQSKEVEDTEGDEKEKEVGKEEEEVVAEEWSQLRSSWLESKKEKQPETQFAGGGGSGEKSLQAAVESANKKCGNCGQIKS